MGEWPNESRLSAVHIRNACDASLKRLQTDHIDLYQMHHVDGEAAWDEFWQAFEVLVQQGKVLYVGSSNFAGWHIAQAIEAARTRADGNGLATLDAGLGRLSWDRAGWKKVLDLRGRAYPGRVRTA